MKRMWLHGGDKLSMVVDNQFAPHGAPHFWGLQSGSNVFLSLTTSAQQEFRRERGDDGVVDLGSNFCLTSMRDMAYTDFSEEISAQCRCHSFKVGDEYTAEDGQARSLEVEPAMKTMCDFAQEMGVDLSNAPPELAQTQALSRADLVVAAHVMCGWYAHDQLPPPKASLMDVVSRVHVVGAHNIEDLPFACNDMGSGRLEWEYAEHPPDIEDIVKTMFGGFPW